MHSPLAPHARVCCMGPEMLRLLLAGIILQYERDGAMKQKPIDLLDLTLDVDVEVSSACDARAVSPVRSGGVHVEPASIPSKQM
jgi:hypothetical protein